MHENTSKLSFAGLCLEHLKSHKITRGTYGKMCHCRTSRQIPILTGNESVADIDVQLYKKYGLGEEEMGFIETHVKAME